MADQDDELMEAGDDTDLEVVADDDGVDEVDGGSTRSRPLEALESDVHSIPAREPVRSKLAADVEAFLSGGGRVEEVPRDFRADPPKRPQSTYGRGSI